MSYRRRHPGLGQAKIVPGQVNFMTLPQGQTALPDPYPLLQAGLPLAPYVEHGSWVTGAPDIMRYGRDPYRGMMGAGDGLGQILTDLACSGSALNASWTTRTQAMHRAGSVAAATGAAIAGAIGAISKKPLVGLIAGAISGYGTYRVILAPYEV